MGLWSHGEDPASACPPSWIDMANTCSADQRRPSRTISMLVIVIISLIY